MENIKTPIVMEKILPLVMILYDGLFIIYYKMRRHTTVFVIYMKTEDENEIELLHYHQHQSERQRVIKKRKHIYSFHLQALEHHLLHQCYS